MEGSRARPRTRIQTEKREAILGAALEVFSVHGFRGSTIDQIASVIFGRQCPAFTHHRPDVPSSTLRPSVVV